MVLIFDVDGTLADTERDGHRVAFNRAFQAAGLAWRWDEALYGKLLSVSGGKERMTRYNLDHGGIDSPDVESVVAELHQRKNQYYNEMLAQGLIGLRPGIRRLLTEARAAGTRLAIATTSVRDNVEALLGNTISNDAITWFELVATADEVEEKKPSSAVYEYVLEHMRVNARECLAFEDSQNGLTASRGAGINTVVCVNDYTRAQDFTGALLVLDHLGEPDKPFKVIAGEKAEHPALSQAYVNLALLEQLII